MGRNGKKLKRTEQAAAQSRQDAQLRLLQPRRRLHAPRTLKAAGGHRNNSAPSRRRSLSARPPRLPLLEEDVMLLLLR